MAKSVSDTVIDAMLTEAEGDRVAVCSAQPTTFYEGIDPSAWQASTAYSLGNAVRPTTRNGFVYECTTAGTSDASEPTWPTTAGNTVNDGTATWTCRENYNLAQETIAGGDFTKANGDTSGRKNTLAAQNTVSIHTTGTADHVAILSNANEALRRVTTATSQSLTEGGTVDIGAHAHEINDPS